MLDVAGFPSLAAHVAHWPSLQAYIYARDRLVWAAERVADLEHAADIERAIVAVQACMACEVCS